MGDLSNAAIDYEGSDTMSAIALTAKPEIGGVSDALKSITIPVPKAGPKEVLIRLHASAMHADEIFAAQGTMLGVMGVGVKHATPSKPYVMGSMVSGVVVAVGSKVTKFKEGDAVISIPATTGEHGSWADFRTIREDMIMKKPSKLSHVQATATAMAACVALGAIDFTQITRRDRCLVVGASGAVGIMMVQMLKGYGAHVTGVCSGRNSKLVSDHGADVVIDYTKNDFAEVDVKYDCVFDAVGGKEIERQAFKALKHRGKFLTVTGPIQYIGERKLSLSEFMCGVAYVCTRYITTKFKKQSYLFGLKMPYKTIRRAVCMVNSNDMRMPVDKEIPFELGAIKTAVKRLTEHRTRGRIVVNFNL